MARDRFDIEREQRTQNRVMGGCVAVIILMLVLMITLGGCSSQKHTQRTERDSTAQSVDSSGVRYTRTDSGVTNWLTLAIQHLKMQLVADSVTLPSGAVIHAPRLMAEADSLTAGKGSAKLHRAETADSAASRATIQSAHREASDKTRDTAAVYDPPDTTHILVIAVVIVGCLITIVIAIRHFKKK